MYIRLFTLLSHARIYSILKADVEQLKRSMVLPEDKFAMYDKAIEELKQRVRELEDDTDRHSRGLERLRDTVQTALYHLAKARGDAEHAQEVVEDVSARLDAALSPTEGGLGRDQSWSDAITAWESPRAKIARLIGMIARAVRRQ